MSKTHRRTCRHLVEGTLSGQTMTNLYFALFSKLWLDTSGVDHEYSYRIRCTCRPWGWCGGAKTGYLFVIRSNCVCLWSCMWTQCLWTQRALPVSPASYPGPLLDSLQITHSSRTARQGGWVGRAVLAWKVPLPWLHASENRSRFWLVPINVTGLKLCTS